jgi:hypothetical protein
MFNNERITSLELKVGELTRKLGFDDYGLFMIPTEGRSSVDSVNFGAVKRNIDNLDREIHEAKKEFQLLLDYLGLEKQSGDRIVKKSNK